MSSLTAWCSMTASKGSTGSSQHERSRSRQQALQVLYEIEMLEGCTTAEVLASGHPLPDVAKVDEFACAIVTGVEEHAADIDERIASISENWALGRMPIVDRNILRIAVYELLYDPEIPPSVAINEAVELAKLFGNDESFKFVNGVLGRAARLYEESGRDSERHDDQGADASAADAGESPE